MVGSAHREVFYERTPSETLRDVVEAMSSIGRVSECNELTKTLIGTTRYGLQRVKLRVSVLPTRGGSVIRIDGAGDDVWGAAARKGADKLIHALSQ